MNFPSFSTVRNFSSIYPTLRPIGKPGNGSEPRLRNEVRSKINPDSRRSYDGSSLRSQTAESSIDELFDVSGPWLSEQEFTSPLPPLQNFTVVGPALLKQFKAIPGDLTAATGKFHMYSSTTKARMDAIKESLKSIVQSEKDYMAAIDRGDKDEANFQERLLTQKLDFVSREFKEVRISVSNVLVSGTGGSRKRRQKMISGMLDMQNRIDEQNAAFNPSPAPLTSEQKSPAQRQRPAKLVRQEAKKKLIERPKAQSQQSATIGSLEDLEKSTGGSSEDVGSLPGSTKVDLPVNQEHLTESDMPPITSFDPTHQAKPMSKRKADKDKKALDAFKAERDAERAAIAAAAKGPELGKEFDAIERRMKSFETLSYKFDPTIKQLMRAVRFSMHEIRKDDTGNAALWNSILADVVNLIESADKWLLAADHIDPFKAGKTMAKMNTFKEHLEQGAHAASKPSKVG